MPVILIPEKAPGGTFLHRLEFANDDRAELIKALDALRYACEQGEQKAAPLLAQLARLVDHQNHKPEEVEP